MPIVVMFPSGKLNLIPVWNYPPRDLFTYLLSTFDIYLENLLNMHKLLKLLLLELFEGSSVNFEHLKLKWPKTSLQPKRSSGTALSRQKVICKLLALDYCVPDAHFSVLIPHSEWHIATKMFTTVDNKYLRLTAPNDKLLYDWRQFRQQLRTAAAFGRLFIFEMRQPNERFSWRCQFILAILATRKPNINKLE